MCKSRFFAFSILCLFICLYSCKDSKKEQHVSIEGESRLDTGVFLDSGIVSQKEFSIQKNNTSQATLPIYKSDNFTGIEKRNDSTFTYALTVKSIESNKIRYRIERLINWKSEPMRYGFAQIDSTSIRTDDWNLRIKDKYLPAFRYLDDNLECPIEILISKATGDAIVFEYCSSLKNRLTGVLQYK